MKAYSYGLNRLGKVGPIPEGMNATAALRVRWLETQHREMSDELLGYVEAFRDREGYVPPYWRLVGHARALVSERWPVAR